MSMTEKERHASFSAFFVPPERSLELDSADLLFKTPAGCSRLSRRKINQNNHQVNCFNSIQFPSGGQQVIKNRQLSRNNNKFKRRKMKETPNASLSSALNLPQQSIIQASLISTNSIISNQSLIASGISVSSSSSSEKTLSNETNSNEPADKKSRIFIGNLNTNLITKRSLAAVFATYGTIKAISLHKGVLISSGD